MRFRIDVFSDNRMKYRIASVTVEADSSDTALQEVADRVEYVKAGAFSLELARPEV